MIGNVIQKKRKEAGLTQAQLAERLGVSAPAVNRWEKNLSFPDATLLAPLARCLKTDLNELFSFYDSLSRKERELIVNKARMMLMSEDDVGALEYIAESVRNNLSDGELYKEMADMLFGWHTIKKASDPMIYLVQIAEYYERALTLLPEKEELISSYLMNVYAESGERQKAEIAWGRLHDTRYEKRWAHAELHFLLKEYRCAVPEIKELVLRKVVDLSRSLQFLHDALVLSGEEDLAALASEKEAAVGELFELWKGIGAVNRISSSISKQPLDFKEARITDMLSPEIAKEKFTACMLFEGVKLGGRSKEESTTADLLADLLCSLQRFYGADKM